MTTLESLFSWILTTTWQASVLAILVLFTQGALGSRLNPRWRHALWLLVILRLVLPDLPESALSLFRYAPAAPLNLPETIPAPEITAPATVTALPLPHDLILPHPNYTFLTLALIWLTGALALLLLTLYVNHRFARHVAHAPPITDEALTKIFANAKAELNVRRTIRLVESSHVTSPAIMGLFTPSLLLPADARDKFTPRELRFIFLHELAHLKRGDIVIQALIALLQILHWFNPVLWYAFRRLRADREPATDALVLSRTGEAEAEPYGLMLLKLLEHFNQRHALPTLVGILEDKDQFKRRFSLIARFTRGAYGWSLLGAFLITALAAVCLTKAKAQDASPRTEKYLELVFVEEPGAVNGRGSGPVSAQDAAKLQNNPKNKATIMADLPLKTGPISLKGQTPAGFSVTVTGDWNATLKTPQKIGFRVDEAPALTSIGTTYASSWETKDLLSQDAPLVIFQGWKPTAHANVIIQIVDHPTPRSGDASPHDSSLDQKRAGLANKLALAAGNGNLAWVETLIDQGADPNGHAKFNPDGTADSVLYRAVSRYHYDVVAYLLEHGAKVQPSSYLDASGHAQTGMLDEMGEAEQLDYHGDARMVKLFWDHGVRSISELSYAITQGASVDDVTRMLAAGSPVDPPQDICAKPLRVAACYGRLDLVTLLIQHGAQVDNPDSANALDFAAFNGRDDIAAFLLQHGAHPRYAAFSGAVSAFNSWYGAGATVNLAHYEHLLRTLLDTGALQELTDKEKGRLLSQAVGHPTLLKMLLDAGLSPELPLIDLAGASHGTVISHVREAAAQSPPDANLKASLALLEAAKNHSGANNAPHQLAQPFSNSSQITAGQKPLLNLGITLVEVSEKAYEAEKAAMDQAVADGNLAYFAARKDAFVSREKPQSFAAGKGWYSQGVVLSYIQSASYDKDKASGKLLTTLNAGSVFLGINGDFKFTVQPAGVISANSTWQVTEPETHPGKFPQAGIFPGQVPSKLDLSPKFHVAVATDKDWRIVPGRPHAQWIGSTLGQITRTSDFHDAGLMSIDGMAKNQVPSRLAVFLTATPASASDPLPAVNALVASAPSGTTDSADPHGTDVAAIVNGKPLYWWVIRYGHLAPQSLEARKAELQLAIDDELAVQEDDADKDDPTYVPGYLKQSLDFAIHGFHGDQAAFAANLKANGLTMENFAELRRREAILGYFDKTQIFGPARAYAQSHPVSPTSSPADFAKAQQELVGAQATLLRNEWNNAHRAKAAIQILDPALAVTANESTAPTTGQSGVAAAKFPEVTISGRLRLVHPEQIMKSTGYLTSVDGGAPIEFGFGPDGTFSIPHVKPGVYNRRIRFVGASGATAETNLEPITVGAASATMTMNIGLDVRVAAPAKNDIQIALKLLEIDDGYYRTHKEKVDAAIERADLAYFAHLEGVTMLSCPSVSTRPDLKAAIDIVREFPYPTDFETPKQTGGPPNSAIVLPPTPREFVTKDVGVSAEITPRINGAKSAAPGKIVLLGRVTVTDFEGFVKSNVDGVANLPCFNTSESNFLEQVGEHELKGVWIPGLHAEEPPAADKNAPTYASATPGASVKRMLLFVSAERVP